MGRARLRDKNTEVVESPQSQLIAIVDDFGDDGLLSAFVDPDEVADFDDFARGISHDVEEESQDQPRQPPLISIVWPVM